LKLNFSQSSFVRSLNTVFYRSVSDRMPNVLRGDVAICDVLGDGLRIALLGWAVATRAGEPEIQDVTALDRA